MDESATPAIVQIPVPSRDLEYSGERFTSAVQGETRHEHYHRYLFALQFCMSRDVLDIASGEGFGSALLSSVATEVWGIDQSSEAIEHAKCEYRRSNLSFRLGNAESIPLEDASVDVVVSFETIEHVTEQETFLSEIQRVLRPGGILIMSSPNAVVYSLGGPSQNPFHVKELDESEFQQLLKARFRYTVFLRQSAFQGSVIIPQRPDKRTLELQGFRHINDNRFEVSQGLPSAPYSICVASEEPLERVQGGTFDDRPFQLGLYEALQYRHQVVLEREATIQQLRAAASSKEKEFEAATYEAQLQVERRVRLLETRLEESFAREMAFQRSLELLEEANSKFRELSPALQQRVMALEEERQSLENRLAENLDSAAALRHYLGQLEEELSNFRTNALSDAVLLGELRTALTDATEKLGDQAARLDALQVEIDRERSESAERVTRSANEARESARTELLTEINRLRERLRLAVEGHTAELSRYHSEASRAAEEIRQSSRRLATAKEDLERSRSELADSRRAHEITKLALSGAKVRFDEVARPFHLLTAEAASLRTATRRAEAENETLKAKLQGFQASLTWKLYIFLLSLARIFQTSNTSRDGAEAASHETPPVVVQQAPVPSPVLFDGKWYLDRNLDVLASGFDPWQHFLLHGVSERRNPHPVFDVAWYLESNLDVAAAGVNPLLHFMEHGAFEGRSPHPLFDSEYYCQTNPDVAEAKVNPLLHYLGTGFTEGRAPHPLFDPSFYLQRNAAARKSGMEPLTHYILTGAAQQSECHPFFDTAYYVSRLPSIPANPLIHFLQSDRSKRPEPNPLFDTKYYLAENRDVAAQTVEPLILFVRYGAVERRSPHPLFDSHYYLRNHPDRENAALNPLRYYLETATRLNVNPHPLFDTDYYLLQLPGKSSRGLAPLVHYVTEGAREGYSPHPLFDVKQYLASHPAPESVQNPLLDYLERPSLGKPSPHPLFDAKFYLDCNWDVKAEAWPPLLHFLVFGGDEGRDPHPLFSSRWYLKTHRDVLEAKINPLTHWVKSGANEGRDPHPLFDTSYYLECAGELKGLNPLLHYFSIGYAADLDPHPLFRTSYYKKQCPELDRAGVNPLAHFLWTGMTEQRDPHPGFDTSYYMANCPDVQRLGMNPLVHFLEYGAALRLNPEPRFDTAFYMETNPEVALWNLNPLVHYLTIGKALGRSPHPAFATALQPALVDLELPDYREAILQKLAAKTSAGLPYQPLVSILVPTYNSPIHCLGLAIESVLNQYYSNWELCLQDDGSTSEATRKALEAWASKDARIHLEFSELNEGISRATNRALHRATGEFVAFLDHDDELLPGALTEIVRKLNEDPSLDAIYTDQDYVNEDGTFSGDFFKPDWSPYLFRGVMYVGHLLVTRRASALAIGGCNPRFDFVQDFEFMLRLSETTDRIAHIPRTLYRWRRIPGSVAFGDGGKQGIEQLQEAAVNAHLARVGIPAIATSNPGCPHRLKLNAVPRKEWPEISVVVFPTENNQELKSCLLSLEDRTDHPKLRISIQTFAEFQASPVPESEYLMFVRGDLKIVSVNLIAELLLFGERPDVAAVAPIITADGKLVSSSGLILRSSGRIEPAMSGFDLRSDGYAGSLSCAREVSALPDDCILISREKFVKLEWRGAYSTGLYRIADLTLQASRQGYRNILNPRACLQRLRGAANPPYDHAEDLVLFREIWRDTLESGDPYHNPNFGDSSFGQIQ